MSKRPGLSNGLRILSVFLLLYFFLASIKLFGSSFKLFGSGFAEGLVNAYSNPFLGLFTGILATSLVQSSSTVTSLIVGLAGAGFLPIEYAIPMIMGANMGTTITNTLVSLTFVTRKEDFRRAFAAATVHDFFNLSAIVVLFPLEIIFHPIQHIDGRYKGEYMKYEGFKIFCQLSQAIVNKMILSENKPVFQI